MPVERCKWCFGPICSLFFFPRQLDNKKCSSIEKLDDNGKVRSETSLDDDGIPADVSVPVPEEVPAKKKRRWEVSVPPPTEESGSGLDDDDKDRRSAGEEEYDSHGEGGVEDRGGKENDPRGRNASEEVLVERKVGRGSEAGEGEKGKGTVEEEVQKRSGRTKVLTSSDFALLGFALFGFTSFCLALFGSCFVCLEGVFVSRCKRSADSLNLRAVCLMAIVRHS